ncbi:MAG: patatin-like phospholipase family protein [Clostridia bacterium]|nr:patatin-like phospholipase family protein [Clostridia bacterium]
MKLFENLKRNNALRREQKENERKLKHARSRATLSAKKNGKVALCLSGGGARGFAHVGAIQALMEENIHFDLVAGTSAGALVGSLYAGGIKPKEIMNYAQNLDLKDVKSGFILKPDSAENIAKLVSHFLGNKTFEQLDKPFYAVATDLVTARQVVLDSGNVATAVSASCAVPLAFKPVVMGEAHLVDGGLLNNIPADVCRMMGADYVITVDVNPGRGEGTNELGIVEVLKATFSIMGANASLTGLMNSDVVISADTSGYSSMKKTGYREMYELGYKSAKSKCEEIINLIYK